MTPDAVFQLDRFHTYKEIRKKIRDGKAQEELKALLEQKKVKELLEYIEIYTDSIESDDPEDKGSKNARELYQYRRITGKDWCHTRKEGLSCRKSRKGSCIKTWECRRIRIVR